MKAVIGSCKRPLMVALAVGLLVMGTSAFGQEVRFYPIRTAALGSAAGTLGAPITPAWNDTLGCWEYAISAGGVEVDVDIQGGGWGNASGNPALGAIQATVTSSGFTSGTGGALVPKGWPATKDDGAYQAKTTCSSNGDPCVPPFDASCAGGANGFCIPSPNWIFTPGMAANDLAAIAYPTQDYGYATAAQNVANTFDPDPVTPRFGTFGGLIVNVPANAAGTYLFGPDPDPNASFMTAGDGSPIAGVTFTPCCITIITGKCCSNIGPNVACEDGLTVAQCNTRPTPRLFVPGDECFGPTPADDCPSCEDDGDCKDPIGAPGDPGYIPDDLCTDGTCNPDGTCTHMMNYDPDVDCCDPATGALITIDDGDVCTNDVCNADGSVDHPYNTSPCNDGFACTVNDVCAEGVCAGQDVNEIPCTSDENCPLGECNLVTELCECSEDTPLLCTIIGGGDQNCFEENGSVEVTVGIGAGSEIVYGGQFLIGYDEGCLELVDVGLCDDSPFEYIIEYDDTVPGVIWFAVTTDPITPVGTPGPANILCFEFEFVGGCDPLECTPSVWFMNQNPRNTILTNNTGNPVPLVVGECKGLRLAGEIDLAVPEGADINADCGLPSAVVTWDAPSATDTCDGDLDVICVAAHDGGLPIGHLLDNGGEFPQGVSFFRCEASNSCGETAVEVWTVDVSDQHGLAVEVHLSPVIAGSHFFRAIDFELYLDCVSDPTFVCEVMEFGGPYNFHAHARTDLKVDKGNYQCITAMDNLHTLRAAADIVCVDNAWEAVFKGDPLQGGNWLIGGNLDDKKAGGNGNTIDILDAGVYLSIIAGNQGTVTPGADTDCDTEFPHGDINADGVVSSDDWSFILENFLSVSKDACCPEAATEAPQPLLSVDAKELARRGMTDLLSGDLNHDGVLDMVDMELYMSGVMPTPRFEQNTKQRGTR